MKIEFNVKIKSYRLFCLFCETIEDNYRIEWVSLKEYTDYKSHPVMHFWNKRDCLYIYKIKNS